MCAFEVCEPRLDPGEGAWLQGPPWAQAALQSHLRLTFGPPLGGERGVFIAWSSHGLCQGFLCHNPSVVLAAGP